MAKRKTKKSSDDISNWAVVLMLVAVIVVSTLSIVLFMDAAEGTITQKAQADGTVALELVNPGEEIESDGEALGEENQSETEQLIAETESAGSVSMQVSVSEGSN